MRVRIIRILFVLLFFLVALSVEAQQERYFAKNMIVGSSFTWIWKTSSDPAISYKFNEYTWNINTAVSMTRRLYLGLQLLNIYTQGSNQSLETFKIYGMFAQYNLLKQTDHRLFVETSLNRGNYCTCGDSEPYQKDNLYYWGIGGGYDLPLKKILPGLYVDIAFINYLIVSAVEDKYAYTQYVIGLNYRFGK